MSRVWHSVAMGRVWLSVAIVRGFHSTADISPRPAAALDPDDEPCMVCEWDWRDSLLAACVSVAVAVFACVHARPSRATTQTLKTFASCRHRVLVTDTSRTHPSILLGQSDTLRFTDTTSTLPHTPLTSTPRQCRPSSASMRTSASASRTPPCGSPPPCAERRLVCIRRR
ncbi:hypothetical protein BC831DRAFT_479305 [Entophlyctis helioformis]|nr:hypothetical protein BC831DRAFT_479305 [Entophlyctis helioformis]